MSSSLAHSGQETRSPGAPHQVAPPHSALTQQNVHGRLAHVVVHVELLAHLFAHAPHHIVAVAVERLHERLEHVLVEGGRDQAPMGAPVVAAADQQPVAQPRLEEPVLVRLLDVHAAVEDQLDVGRIGEHHHQLGADPDADDVLVGLAQAQRHLEDLCAGWKFEGITTIFVARLHLCTDRAYTISIRV